MKEPNPFQKAGVSKYKWETIDNQHILTNDPQGEYNTVDEALRDKSSWPENA